VLGRPVDVVCESPDVERLVRDTYADVIGSPTGSPERILVSGDAPQDSLAALAEALDEAVIRLGTGDLMPRAAAVARPDGSVALICGRPAADASALAAALLRLGCAYLTDGITVLAPSTLEVSPLRRPITLGPEMRRYAGERPSWAGAEDSWPVRASTLGAAAVPTEPLEARLMLFLHLDPRAARPQVERLSEGDVAYRVGVRCLGLGAVTGGPLPALSRLARRAPGYRIRCQDPGLAAGEVFRLWQTT
jgi:hypothetical protein